MYKHPLAMITDALCTRTPQCMQLVCQLIVSLNKRGTIDHSSLNINVHQKFNTHAMTYGMDLYVMTCR